MAANPKDHLSIDVEPELRHRIEREASRRNVSLQDYVISILQLATSDIDPEDDESAWGRLAIPSFARDWDSDEDRVYDSLS